MAFCVRPAVGPDVVSQCWAFFSLPPAACQAGLVPLDLAVLNVQGPLFPAEPPCWLGVQEKPLHWVPWCSPCSLCQPGSAGLKVDSQGLPLLPGL